MVAAVAWDAVVPLPKRLEVVPLKSELMFMEAYPYIQDLMTVIYSRTRVAVMKTLETPEMRSIRIASLKSKSPL